jgi:hypothetical protein
MLEKGKPINSEGFGRQEELMGSDCSLFTNSHKKERGNGFTIPSEGGLCYD